MGSLPNLDHVLERREREKEKVLARERAREREFCHDLDSWRERALSMQAHRQNQRPIVPHQRRVIRTRSTGNTHHLTDEPLENLLSKPGSAKSYRMSPQQHYTLPPVPNFALGHHHSIIQPQNSNPISSSRRRESANSSVGSVRRLLTINRGCRQKIPVHVRAKVIKNFIFLVIGHGLISATLLPLIGLQASNSVWVNAVEEKQETMSSVVADERINVSSMSLTAAAAADRSPVFLGPFPTEIGSLLLSMTFLLTSGMCFLTAVAIKRIGHYSVILCGYVGVAIFLAGHLMSSYYILLPAYLVFGLVYGPLSISKLNLVIVMANKLSCGQHECCNAISTPTVNTAGLDTGDEHILFATKPSCSRDENIRRFSRWYHAVQNFGTIVGTIIIALLLTCSSFHRSDSVAECGATNRRLDPVSFSYSPIVSNEYLLISQPLATESTTTTEQLLVDEDPVELELIEGGEVREDVSTAPIAKALLTMRVDPVSENYMALNRRERICGAALCPVWWMQSAYVPKYVRSVNATGSNSFVRAEVFPPSRKSFDWRIDGTIIVYLILGVLAISVTVFIGKFTNKKNLNPAQSHHYRYNSIPGLLDTLFFAGPLAYFMGTEQGYILADFMKAFVSCSLGPHMVAGALIGMGIMQLIASCTLSMLLRHTKRIVVIIAGFFFHACLLLVLSRWKPSKDDSALFYVIAAAWGVCHAVWDTLLFTLLSLTHKNHMLEALSPIHGIQYLAMGITFAAHGFLCEFAKIIVLAILLIISVPPYTSLELRLEAQRKIMQNNTNKSMLQIPTL